MDILLKKRDHLERQIQQFKQKESDRMEYKSRLEERAEEQKRAIEAVEKEIHGMELVLLEKKEKFVCLKEEVSKYKKEILDRSRGEYRSLYIEIFEEASRIRPSTSFSTFGEFSRIEDLIGKNVFRNLGRRLKRFYSEEKEKLRKYILSQIEKKLEDKRKMHEVVFNMKFLSRYEQHFSENVLEHFLYERTSKAFEYHFLSDRDSNRLDKPEWFLDFILAKLKESREIFDMYLDLNKKDTKADGLDGRFGDLVKRMCDLIKTKTEEISGCNSKQKRNLILHLGMEIMKFRYEVYHDYSIILEFPELGHTLCKEQKKYVREKLSKIHESRHVKWFGGYKELLRECLLYIYRFRALDSAFGIDDAIQTIIDYNKIFLESLRYINRQEIRVLCWVYSEFERLKTFLLDQESEVVFDARLSMESKVVDVKKNGDSQDMLHEAVTGSLERVSEFNSENLKLIMSLAANDASEGLRPIRKFFHDPSRIFRNLVIDIGKYLDDYRECLSYDAIKRDLKERTDMFVLEEIILKYRLETSEYFELAEMIRRLEEVFGEGEWKSEMALECVGDIFEGRDAGQGPLSEIIRSLYE
ncbi:RINT-1-like protein [Encephalitozoon hellem]|nr:RINT-1-like protein [Encephalitozoon hellem]